MARGFCIMNLKQIHHGKFVLEKHIAVGAFWIDLFKIYSKDKSMQMSQIEKPKDHFSVKFIRAWLCAMSSFILRL